ncbi:MAG: GspE/PulE family protein [Planctomycetota bacterium]|jgi:type IV pilus assembly protein PilB
MELRSHENPSDDISLAGSANNTQTNPASGADALETQDTQTILVQGDPASDEIKAQSIAKQHGLDFIRLSELDLSLSWVRLLPEWFVRKHKVITVKLEKDTLYVAMINPLDLPTLDHINLITGLKIKPMVATERDIIQAIKSNYGVEQMTKQDFVDARLSQEHTEEADGIIEDLASSSETSRIVRLISSTIKDAIDSTASDIHFEPSPNQIRVRFRVDGILHDSLTIPGAMRNEVISRVKVLAKLDITEKRKAQDGHIVLKYKESNYDLRVSVIPTVDGEKVVIRILDKNKVLVDLSTLGLYGEQLESIESIVNRPHGMVLVTGPTGSGKTTTLYAMLRSINAIEKNIVTIENPVEYTLDRINQIQINPDSGETFASALRSILRQDPDVIMVGEIRDEETADVAVQAALTGHLVFCTLHTNDAVTAITRLRELGIAPFLVASCVVMAVAQRLVRKICPDCRATYQPDKKTLKLMGIDDTDSDKFIHGKGCAYCFNTGFRGREAVLEVLKLDNDIQEAITRDSSALEIKKIAVQKKMKTLLDAGIFKALEGKTSVEEIRRVIVPETIC